MLPPNKDRLDLKASLEGMRKFPIKTIPTLAGPVPDELSMRAIHIVQAMAFLINNEIYFLDFDKSMTGTERDQAIINTYERLKDG